jgi:hypothetical protein
MQPREQAEQHGCGFKEEDRYYVLKDSWTLSSHPFSELETLKKINDVMKGNPEAQKSLRHCYPILQILGDSTGSIVGS